MWRILENIGEFVDDKIKIIIEYFMGLLEAVFINYLLDFVVFAFVAVFDICNLIVFGLIFDKFE